MADDETTDDPAEGAPDPAAQLENGGPGPQIAAPTPPSDIDLERWWRSYLGLPPTARGIVRLSAIVHASPPRVRWAVKKGWPERGIISFEERLRLAEAEVRGPSEQAREAATARGAAAVAELVVTKWEHVAREQIENLVDVSAAIKQLAANVAKASEGASFVSYRRVPDVDAAGNVRRDSKGEPIMVLKPFVSGGAVALATARLAAAAKDYAVLHKALLDSINPLGDSGIDLTDAPPEVLEYLQRRFMGRAVG